MGPSTVTSYLCNIQRCHLSFPQATLTFPCDTAGGRWVAQHQGFECFLSMKLRNWAKLKLDCYVYASTLNWNNCSDRSVIFLSGMCKKTKQPESAAALLVCYTTSLSSYTVHGIWHRRYHQGRRNKEIVRNRRNQRPIWTSHIPTAWGAIKPGWRFQRCCCSGSNLPRWPSQFTDKNVILMDGLEPGMTRVKNLQKILYV